MTGAARQSMKTTALKSFPHAAPSGVLYVAA